MMHAAGITLLDEDGVFGVTTRMREYPATEEAFAQSVEGRLPRLAEQLALARREGRITHIQKLRDVANHGIAETINRDYRFRIGERPENNAAVPFGSLLRGHLPCQG